MGGTSNFQDYGEGGGWIFFMGGGDPVRSYG